LTSGWARGAGGTFVVADQQLLADTILGSPDEVPGGPATHFQLPGCRLKRFGTVPHPISVFWF